MWTLERAIIREGESEKLALSRNGASVSFAEIIAAWRQDKEFRDFFIRELAAIRFPAYFWEMPPVRRDMIGRSYEFVVVRSDALADMHPDPDAFSGKFRDVTRSVATFRNLGGDALLLAPRPSGEAAHYTHLAAFLRGAPAQQRHDLFVFLAEAIDRELLRTASPIWISTSGLGVGWLHIRLDSVPKYYQHRPYAQAC
ncbi:MAG TPA: hypothetical protein VHU23_01910 [Rhizomicrobium sp.]|jgi:hypothetical protein|nr:hypothetical protein [Rhizomicrobium sp.]